MAWRKYSWAMATSTAAGAVFIAIAYFAARPNAPPPALPGLSPPDVTTSSVLPTSEDPHPVASSQPALAEPGRAPNASGSESPTRRLSSKAAELLPGSRVDEAGRLAIPLSGDASWTVDFDAVTPTSVQIVCGDHLRQCMYRFGFEVGFDGCIAQIPVCASAKPWASTPPERECCVRSCIDGYRRARAAGKPPSQAYLAMVGPSCVGE